MVEKFFGDRKKITKRKFKKFIDSFVKFFKTHDCCQKNDRML